MSKNITVSQFINTKYRNYWESSNKNGKNSVDPREQLPEVIRKIIYASYRLRIRERDEHKTTELMGEVGKFHAHGPSSIEDSIKGVATAYKSQPETRILEGVGNFGSAPGDEGSAGRYTHIAGTPLLSMIYKDIPFVPFNTDDTGLEQPEYISMPLPMSLICGASPIGTGKSCYVAERNAEEVINWIDELRKNDWDSKILPPAPMSVTGCKTWFNETNGYVYYEAVVHYGVDDRDLNKKGRFDIITALPPKSTPANTIYKLKDKLPSRITDKILDGSGRGMKVCIRLPKGYLDEKDFAKYGMRTARKEQIYLWDHKLNTMRQGELLDIAKGWFEDRCEVVIRRLNQQIEDLKDVNHKLNLIAIYAEQKMTNWKSEEIIDYFVNLFPETGKEDANLVLSQSARSFLPENLKKNAITKEKNLKEIEDLQKKVENIGDVVIEEARYIMEEQRKFFNGEQ